LSNARIHDVVLASGRHAIAKRKMMESIPKTTRKGEQTRAAILAAALALAGREGLEGLTIGLLADKMGMSKSGVFAHFGSREELQLAVLKLYHLQFEQEVVHPSMREPSGLPRLFAIFERWMQLMASEAPFGCLYVSGAAEYDDRPGLLRDALVAMVRTRQESLHRCVEQSLEAGHLRAATDPQQVVFEMYGLILALHHDLRFVRRPGSIDRAQAAFYRMIDNYRNPLARSSIKPTLKPASKSAKKTA
jgi:AcrR family transcriptional regulator